MMWQSGSTVEAAFEPHGILISIVVYANLN